MRAYTLIMAIVLLAAFGTVSPASAEEYYVVKSRSGVVRIVDHKPKGGATIVKGPFKSKEEAEKTAQTSAQTGDSDLKR
jgi:hypothetical protein